MVFLGLVTAWRLAGAPTSTSPSFENATMDGVVRSPSEFSMTRVLVPSMTATHELVVPRSIPMILLMFQLLKGLRSKDRRILNTNWGLAAFSQVEAARGRDRTFMPQRQKTGLRTGPLLRLLRHRDQRGAEQPSVQHVALL